MEATDAAQYKRQVGKHLGEAIRFLQKMPASPYWTKTLVAIEKYVREWDVSATGNLSKDLLEEERYKNACTFLNEFLMGYHYNTDKTFHVGHEEPLSDHPAIHVGVEDAEMEHHLRQFLPGGCLWQGFSVEINVYGRMEIDTTAMVPEQGGGA